MEQNYTVKWIGRSGNDNFSPFRFTKEKAEALCSNMNKLNGQYHSPTLLSTDELGNYHKFERLDDDGNVKTWDIEEMERVVGGGAIGLACYALRVSTNRLTEGELNEK